MLHDRRFFRELEPNIPWRSHPLDVIRYASRNANLVPQSEWDDHTEFPGATREVLYIDTTGTTPIVQRLTLRLVQHAGGAWDVDNAVLGTQQGSPEGRILAASGVMASVATVATDIQGCLFGQYFDAGILRRRDLTDPVPVIDLQNGDWYWVVIDGPYEFLSGEVLSDNDLIGISGVGAGVGRAEIATEAEAIGRVTAAAGAAGVFTRGKVSRLKGLGFTPNEF